MTTNLLRCASIAATTLLALVLTGAGDSAATGESAKHRALADSAPSTGFAITVVDERLVVFQGGSATVRLRLARSASVNGVVSVTATGLPPGVSAAPALIAAEATETELRLSAAATAPHTLPTRVLLAASASVGGSQRHATTGLVVTVRGTSGSLDTSFGGGIALTAVGPSEDYAHAVAVQSDGKVLVAGSSATHSGTHTAVVRYHRDGSLDAGFGHQGKAVAALGARQDVAHAIALQSDGRIVVAGHSLQGKADHDFALMRFMPDGSPDAGFGDQGRVLTDFGGDSDRAYALTLLADGRIVAGGQSNLHRSRTGMDFALARYLADGRLDPSFGQGGKVVAPILPGSMGDLVRGLAVQTVDGSPRVLAVGGEGDFTVARFTESGALDITFGHAGKVTGLFGVNIGSAHAVTVLPGGESVIAGHVGHDFAAVQLTPDGRLDGRFGPARDGRFRHAISAQNWDEATAIARQADGGLLLGGWLYAGTGTAGDFAVLRLTADGRLDAGFAQEGVFTQAVAGTKADFGRALALQPDERVPAVRALIAGEAQTRNRDFALIRLWL